MLEKQDKFLLPAETINFGGLQKTKKEKGPRSAKKGEDANPLSANQLESAKRNEKKNWRERRKSNEILRKQVKTLGRVKQGWATGSLTNTSNKEGNDRNPKQEKGRAEKGKPG